MSLGLYRPASLPSSLQTSLLQYFIFAMRLKLSRPMI